MHAHRAYTYKNDEDVVNQTQPEQPLALAFTMNIFVKNSVN